jgi:hypothetical protein
VNQSVIDFVKNLMAAYPKYPTSGDTIELYYNKLSKWNLTLVQWELALESILEHHKDEKGFPNENIPTLTEIYPYLRNSRNATAQSNYGWLSFVSDNKQYSVRVQYVDGKWVNASMIHTDNHGKQIALQKYVGQIPVLPIDSTEIIYNADSPDSIHN